MKRIYIIGILLGTLISSCTSTQYLPKPRDYDRSVYGAYVVVKHKDPYSVTRGELLAVTRDSIIIFNMSSSYSTKEKIITLALTDIKKVKVQTANIVNSSGGILAWAALLLPVSLTHGIFMILSLPLNIINLSVMAVGISGNYYFEVPDNPNWAEVAKYARYPQGWPEGLNKKDVY